MDARRGSKKSLTPSKSAKGGVGISQKDNFAGQPTVRATETAKFVQSFDEVSLRQEQPGTMPGGWVPKGSPKRDTLFPDLPAQPMRLQAYDERQNVGADNQTLSRDTPESDKGKKDQRPDWLYRFTSEAGEDIT